MQIHKHDELEILSTAGILAPLGRSRLNRNLKGEFDGFDYVNLTNCEKAKVKKLTRTAYRIF